ncbi:hypothetical protein ABK703_23305 [Klebsiella quasipneumoniae]|uniref:hypothetical protein n=1 Tax=Klebsiella quasipneumoniae TaxID=1463165 RepID=UPI003751EA2A
MGVAIMAAGTDAAAYSNNYIPPVASPLVWGNLESSAIPESRRSKNWGSAGGNFSLSGNAAFSSVGVSAAAGVDSRLTLGTFSPDAYTMIGLVDVGVSAGIMRHRDIRLTTSAEKKLGRSMTAGSVVSDIVLPASGAFVVFLQGDLTGHVFGMATRNSVTAATASTAVNTGTSSTFLGGSNASSAFAAWSGYGVALYPRKLSNTEIMLVAERLLKRAAYLGVTVNG